MTTPRLLMIGAMTLACTAVGWADDGHTFPVEGKVYLIHRFNNANSYIYENNASLFASAKTNTQKQYWQFVPTEKANCYYIQNVTSKRYVQSSKAVGENGQIKTGTTPIEFEIKANTTAGEAPQGYYYMCSTDQTISTAVDGTLGLNFKDTGQVVAFHIRYNRGNSYWDIVESDYDYEPPAPIERSEYCKKLGIYLLPCGDLGDGYLKQLSLSGSTNDVPNSLDYTATAKPSSYYTLVRTDSAEVVQGAQVSLSYEAASLGKDYTVTAYFDWDKDGIFEAKQEFLNAANGQAEIEVPDTAALGKHRLRVRITDNALDDAEDDVHGTTYDFQLFVVKKGQPTAVDQAAKPNAEASCCSAKAYGVDGMQVKPETHKGVYIQKGQKKVK